MTRGSCPPVRSEPLKRRRRRPAPQRRKPRRPPPSIRISRRRPLPPTPFELTSIHRRPQSHTSRRNRPLRRPSIHRHRTAQSTLHQPLHEPATRLITPRQIHHPDPVLTHPHLEPPRSHARTVRTQEDRATVGTLYGQGNRRTRMGGSPYALGPMNPVARGCPGVRRDAAYLRGIGPAPPVDVPRAIGPRARLDARFHRALTRIPATREQLRPG